MKIKENILNILANCTIEGNTLLLPPEQLDRATYINVNKCLDSIGGKWNKKAKGHIFDYDPTEAFENLVMTGETEDMKKTFQFFPTPKNLAEKVCKIVDVKHIDTSKGNIFEPSCGKGDLADVIYEQLQPWQQEQGVFICNELNADMKKYLAEKPYTVMYDDFLNYKPDQIKPFSAIVMNPPFSKQQDIDHVVHAYKLLNGGGVLVSIMSISWTFRDNNKSVDFRKWLESVNAEIFDVDAGAFKESGTMIPTKIIKVVKQ